MTDSTADLARATLALDELFITGLSTHERAAVEANLPPGTLDQMNAAAAETLRTLTLEGALTGTALIPANGSDVPEWIRLPLIGTLLEWTTGHGKVCPHNPRISSPEPVLAAAWKPGLVVCTRCVHLLNPRKSERFLCDCCGRHDDHLACQRVAYNSLTYSFGACRDCAPVPPTPAEEP